MTERGDRRPADQGAAGRVGSGEVDGGRAPENPDAAGEPAQVAPRQLETRDALKSPVRGRRSQTSDLLMAADDGNHVLHRTLTPEVLGKYTL